MVTMTTTKATILYLRTRILTPTTRNVLPCHGGERVKVLCVVNCYTSNAIVDLAGLVFRQTVEI